LEKAIKRTYQHVVFLAQPNPDVERTLDQVTFDDEHQTSLDGTQVWKALADREKVFDTGQFNARALMHNLRDSDYGRPLSEIRDAFWNAPRLPLLIGGERDLQNAIYQAVKSGELCIVDSAGNPVAVTDPSQVNLSSGGLRLGRPRSTTVPDDGRGAKSATGGASAGSSRTKAGRDAGTQTPSGSGPGSGEDTPTVSEKYVTFPLLGNLLDKPDKVEALAQVFRTLYSILDDNHASYAQGSVQLVVTAEAADRLAEQIRSLGLNVTVRDQ
jgi:hypothetical protein